jgi:RHH-type transcriptional regulator, rel operon repressor / antitoxin RelB
MIAIELDPETEEWLERLAKETGRSKSICARDAILAHLEDLEDVEVATKRLLSPERICSSQEVKRELGL